MVAAFSCYPVSIPLFLQMICYEKIIVDQIWQKPGRLFCIFFGRLDCVGRSFAYVAHFGFLRDVWIRTQKDAVASRRATNIATLLPN